MALTATQQRQAQNIKSTAIAAIAKQGAKSSWKNEHGSGVKIDSDNNSKLLAFQRNDGSLTIAELDKDLADALTRNGIAPRQAEAVATQVVLTANSKGEVQNFSLSGDEAEQIIGKMQAIERGEKPQERSTPASRPLAVESQQSQKPPTTPGSNFIRKITDGLANLLERGRERENDVPDTWSSDQERYLSRSTLERAESALKSVGKSSLENDRYKLERTGDTVSIRSKESGAELARSEGGALALFGLKEGDLGSINQLLKTAVPENLQNQSQQKGFTLERTNSATLNMLTVNRDNQIQFVQPDTTEGRAKIEKFLTHVSQATLAQESAQPGNQLAVPVSPAQMPPPANNFARIINVPEPIPATPAQVELAVKSAERILAASGSNSFDSSGYRIDKSDRGLKVERWGSRGEIAQTDSNGKLTAHQIRPYDVAALGKIADKLEATMAYVETIKPQISGTPAKIFEPQSLVQQSAAGNDIRNRAAVLTAQRVLDTLGKDSYENNSYRFERQGENISITAKNGRGTIAQSQNGQLTGDLSNKDVKALSQMNAACLEHQEQSKGQAPQRSTPNKGQDLEAGD